MRLTSLKRKYKFYIGIDCGVNTGFCVWHADKKEVYTATTVKIHTAMQMLKAIVETNKDLVFVRVEDARKRKWIPKEKTEKAERGVREGAGSVKRDAKIWEDFLDSLNVDYELVAPKNNKTKVTSEYFKQVSKFAGSTSQHARDAAMLVIGF